MVDKKVLREKFAKEWEKHYKLDFFEREGFVRKRCPCGTYFWTLDEERAYCGEPEHTGYLFIGKPAGKPKSYEDTWFEMARFYERHGHAVVPRYPVVARWRDDLYFTIASIAVFQPYVVRGEVDPPANPLLIPQPSLRFKDIENVGFSGRHFTSFVMVGQHAFNKERMVLWKEEAIEQIFNYMTKEVGIPPEEIVFHEDVWAGGGNFGPSIEYFVRGLELGNVVFMQFEEVNGGYRELEIKVIDHGIGLSRFAWIRNGTFTPYEIVLPSTVEYTKSFVDVEIPEEVLERFFSLAGKLNFDEVQNAEEVKRGIEKEINYPGFFKEYEPLAASFAIADHARTLLFAIHDGAFPSNVGGGYNLRVLARRIFSFQDRFNWDLDYEELFGRVARDQSRIFPELKEAVELAADVLRVEREKYEKSKERGRRRVAIVAKKGKITVEDLKLLYESYGVTPEDVRTIAEEMGIEVEIPEGFYALLEEPRKKKREKKKLDVDVSKYPKTVPLYYENPYLREFEATVLGIEGDWVILDKTAFYPEGGGQEADRGTLNGVDVLDVQKIDGVILHRVKEPTRFVPGQKVKGNIDWERRSRLMRHHTATHIVLAAARKVLGRHVWQEGAHKSEEEAHIDVSHYKSITREELEAIEREANKIVMENRRVKTYWMERGEAERRFGITIYQGGAVPGKTLRIVEIEGIDVEACGGTHVSQTGEIGLIKIVSRKSVADGIERLTYKAGDVAVSYVQELEKTLKKTAELFRVGIEDVPKTAEKFIMKLKEVEKTSERLKKELAKVLASQVSDGILVIEESDPKLASLVYEIYEGDLIVVARTGRPNVMVFGKRTAEIVEKLRQLGAKGGGKGDRAFLFVEGDADSIVEKIKQQVL